MNDFFAMLYEGFNPLNLFYIEGFSADMYDAEAYVLIGLIMLISSFVLEVAYYYVIANYGNFYKKSYWFIWLLFIAIINFIVAYHLSVVELENFYSSSPDDYPYDFSQHAIFSMVNLLWAVLFSFVFSITLKIKSVMGSRTPF